MGDFLLYHRITKETGKALANELGIENGEEYCGGRLTTLIRWGNAMSIRHVPETTLNKKSALELVIDKFASTQLFAQHRIKTPEFTTTVPAIARTRTHTQGQGLWFCWLPEQLEEVRHEGADYFIKYIATKQEWRVHVIDGEVVFVQRKYDVDRRTTAFGGVQQFRNNWHKQVISPSEAPPQVSVVGVQGCQTLGLDFGGSDVIEGLDGRTYLIEVNSGPSLPNEQTRAPYLEYFRRKLGR